MGSIKIVLIAFAISFGVIIFITNEKVRSETFGVLNHKIGKSRFRIYNLFLILITIIFILYSIKLLNKSKIIVGFITKNTAKQEEDYEKYKKIADSQNQRYQEIVKTIEVNLENCKNPYIPDGFSYVEGEWNTGFVIEDEKQNQFVWVPCTNKGNEEGIPVLEKAKFKINNTNWSNCYEEEDYEEFLMSSLENGGFYISRFEVGKEEEIPVSKFGATIWRNINREEAKEKAEMMYSQIHSKLINGYAMDTAVKFIFEEMSLRNVLKSSGISGNASHKNIYDLADDMNEWTSEMRGNLKIYRTSLPGDGEFESILNDRFSNDAEFTSDNLGFRTIIYK